MAALLRPIIQAAVDGLNGWEFSRAFTASRGYDVQHALEELAEWRVTLIPAGATAERAARADDQEDYIFDVVVQKRVNADNDAEADAVADLLGEVFDWFRGKDLMIPDARASVWKRELPQAAEAGYVLDTLRSEGVFTGVVRVTVRVYR